MAITLNKMKKIWAQVSLVLMLTISLSFFTTRAQSDEDLILSLRRNFGYSSGTGKIQGTFTITITGPDSLNRVVYIIDDEVMGEVTTSPYKLQFQTNDYPLGIHTITALGYTHDGTELHANHIRVEFVSAEAGWQSAMKIVIPLLVIVFGGMILSYTITTLTGRRSKSYTPLGAPRSYGLWGGAVCPRCSRPFARHLWGLNLGAGKFDRCPHCGKWSLVHRAHPNELRAAEAAELETSSDLNQTPEISEEEKLRKELEDSRYQDL